VRVKPDRLTGHLVREAVQFAHLVEQRLELLLVDQATLLPAAQQPSDPLRTHHPRRRMPRGGRASALATTSEDAGRKPDLSPLISRDAFPSDFLRQQVGVRWLLSSSDQPPCDREAGASLQCMTDPRTHLGDEADAIRKAKNEIQLRKLNERIEEHHLRIKPSMPAWVCECADETCARPVEMSIAEYEAIRSEPTQFFVVPSPGHVSLDIEYVVRREPAYWVIAKKGVGAAMSREDQDVRRT
jgi:hypothetical protein